VDNKNLFHVNSEIHWINTRQNSNFHQPQANPTLYQKGTYYSGIKAFNNLPPNLRNLSCDVKRFKLELGNIKYQKDIGWVRQTQTIYYGVGCPRVDYMFRPFSIRPSSGLTWWKP